MVRLPVGIDIHTHIGAPRPDAILCVDPTVTDILPPGDGLLSVGIHPWNAHLATDTVWQRLVNWISDPRVAAIGESGLDTMRGPDTDTQLKTFERHIQIARQHQLPLIIHNVRSTHHLLRLRKKQTYEQRTQWINHGFRGKPELARQLLDADIDLSFGKEYNPESYNITPPDRRYHESDTHQI